MSRIVRCNWCFWEGMENKRKFIDGYMWMYGVTKRQAMMEYQLSWDGYRKAIIEAWERHCKRAIDD